MRLLNPQYPGDLFELLFTGSLPDKCYCGLSLWDWLIVLTLPHRVSSATLAHEVRLSPCIIIFLSNVALFSKHISTLPLPGQHAADLVLAERNRASLYKSNINWLQTDGCVFCKEITTKRASASIFTPASGLSDLTHHQPTSLLFPSPELFNRASSGFSLHLGLMPKASQACSSQRAANPATSPPYLHGYAAGCGWK